MTPREAHQAISQLHVQLINITSKDQEQEVRGIAMPVLDAVLSSVRGSLLEADPVLATLPDLISPEAIETGEPIRAVDALLVVGQLEIALDRAMSARPKNEGTARLI